MAITINGSGSIAGVTNLTTTGVALEDAALTDPAITGGIYIGGTGAANKLDDYEEGTWTPTATAGITSFTLQSATYVKIGRAVTVTLYVSNISGNSGSSLGIGGLPFTVATGEYFTGSFDSASDGKMGMMRTLNASSGFNAYYPNASTNLRTNYLGTDLGDHIIGSFTYFTNS